MPGWEIDPFKTVGDNTPETQLEQIDQELESMARRLPYLLEEKSRLLREVSVNLEEQ